VGSAHLDDFLVCGRKKICVHVTWTRFWVIGHTILLHGRVYSSSDGVKSKVVTWSLPKNLLVYFTYRHMRTKRHADIWTSVCTQHSTHSQMTRQKIVFGLVDRQWDGSFVHCEGHSGLGCVSNMKVCVLGSDSMLWEHNLLFNSWSSHSRSCDQPLLPCFHTPHFTDVVKGGY
jgi:hypothetical protein